MSAQENQVSKGWIVYPIGSRPKWGLALLLGIQQYLTMFGATVLIPFIVGGAMQLPPDQLALMISTIFFTSGLCTLIQQSPIGNRLPIVQGGTFSFLGPTFAIIGMVAAKNLAGPEPMWQIQIQEVSGAIMIASVVEIILGYSGIMGQIKKAISPIVIGPTIAMIGLALFNIGAPWMAGNWIIGLLTLVAMIVYSQILSHKSRGFHAISHPVGHRHRMDRRLDRHGSWMDSGRQRGLSEDRPDRSGPLDQLPAPCAVQMGISRSGQYDPLGRGVRHAGRVSGLHDRVHRRLLRLRPDFRSAGAPRAR